MEMRTRNAWHAALLLIALAGPGLALAQKLERPKDWEPGDKAAYNWVLNNKAQAMEDEFTALTDTEFRVTTKVGDKTYDAALSKDGPALLKAICLSNGQPCTFSPALRFAEFPLEKGKKWTTPSTVTGETFVSEIAQERVVEKIEKVKVPAGEFEAYKVSFRSRITGKDAKGNAFSGKEDGSDWFAVSNGKLLLVKTVYRNSFGEKFTRELTSVSYK
jgi:hypothetical protein